MWGSRTAEESPGTLDDQLPDETRAVCSLRERHSFQADAGLLQHCVNSTIILYVNYIGVKTKVSS